MGNFDTLTGSDYLGNADSGVPGLVPGQVVSPGIGGSSLADLFTQALSNPASVAKALGSAGFPAPSGVQAPAATPGLHFDNASAGSISYPPSVTGQHTAAGQMALQQAGKVVLPTTLGALIASGTAR